MLPSVSLHIFNDIFCKSHAIPTRLSPTLSALVADEMASIEQSSPLDIFERCLIFDDSYLSSFLDLSKEGWTEFLID